MKIRMCMLLISSLLLAGCAGSNQPATNIPVGPATGLPVNLASPALVPAGPATIPDSLPADRLQPWEAAGSRTAAAIDPEMEYFAGRDWFSTSATGASDNSEALRLSAPAAEMAWAMYRLPLQGSQPGTLSADINLLNDGTGSSSRYSIAVANYGSGRWDWHGPFTEAHLRLPLSLAIREGADYLSGIGNCFVCVLVDNGNSVDVVGFGANAFDESDSLAPPVVSGLEADPVAGGIELTWNPVLAGDLAGYFVSHADQPDFNPLEIGPASSRTVTGYHRYILTSLPAGSFIRVFAIDNSGNLGPAGPALSMDGLSEDPLRLLLESSEVSVQTGEDIVLQASGATFLDYDFDGDGIFEVVQSDDSQVSLPSSIPGLYRVIVRGSDAGGTRRQMAGISYIVGSNQRPVAVASATPATGQVPLDVQLSGNGSYDPDGAIVEGAWDLDGNGLYDIVVSPQEILESGLSHTVQSTGLVISRLIVFDEHGAHDVAETAMYVLPASPVARLVATPAFGLQGESVFLDASSSEAGSGTLIGFEWDLDGDGQFDSGSLSSGISHVYQEAGVYHPAVRVTDDAGGTASATYRLVINESAGLHTAWPALGRDSRNTCRSPYQADSMPALEWSFGLSNLADGSPVIGNDGTVYIGSRDTNLYAVNPDGTERWAFMTSDEIHASPLVDQDGTVYCASKDGNIYAINPDGTEKWSLPLDATTYSSPCLAMDGSILIACASILYSLNQAGNIQWSFDTSGQMRNKPAISINGSIYICTEDRLVALNPDGSFQWAFQAEASVSRSTPSIAADGTIHFGSNDNFVYAVNPDGSLRWKYEARGNAQGVCGIAVDGTVYAGGTGEYLMAIDADGNLKWEYLVGGWMRYAPAIDAKGNVYVGSSARLVALDAAGELLWSHEENTGLHSPAIAEDGSLYVCSFLGSLYAFRDIEGPGDWAMYGHDRRNSFQSTFNGPASGNLLWTASTADSLLTDPVIGIDGSVFVGCSDHRLYRFSAAGEFQWSYHCGGLIRNSAAIGEDGTIYVSTTNNGLQAVNPDGSSKWSYALQDTDAFAPAVSQNGNILVIGESDKLYAIDPQGLKQWEYTAGGLIRCTAAIADDETIYITSADGYLTALNPDGSLKWTYDSGNLIAGTPSVDDNGLIFFCDNSNALHVVNPDGSPAWNYSPARTLFESQALANDGRIYIKDSYGDLLAINPDATLAWEFDLNQGLGSTPALGADGQIYIGGGTDNRLYCLDPDGNISWFVDTGAQLETTPAIGADGTLYVSGSDGMLYAIGV